MHDLVDAGLVRLPRRGALRTLAFKLTDRGDQVARSLIGVSDILGASTVMKLIELTLEILERPGAKVQASAEDEDEIEMPWIPETALSGGKGWGDGLQDELVIVETMALPCLARQWVEARSDLHRHVYYRVTPRGRDEAPDAEPLPDLPGEVPGMAQFHADELGKALERLRSVRDRGVLRDIGDVPLPCSMPV